MIDFDSLAEDVANYICDLPDLKTLRQYYYANQIAYLGDLSLKELVEYVTDCVCDSEDLKTLRQYCYDNQIVYLKDLSHKELVEFVEYYLPNFNIEDYSNEKDN